MTGPKSRKPYLFLENRQNSGEGGWGNCPIYPLPLDPSVVGLTNDICFAGSSVQGRSLVGLFASNASGFTNSASAGETDSAFYRSIESSRSTLQAEKKEEVPTKPLVINFKGMARSFPVNSGS